MVLIVYALPRASLPNFLHCTFFGIQQIPPVDDNIRRKVASVTRPADQPLQGRKIFQFPEPRASEDPEGRAAQGETWTAASAAAARHGTVPDRFAWHALRIGKEYRLRWNLATLCTTFMNSVQQLHHHKASANTHPGPGACIQDAPGTVPLRILQPKFSPSLTCEPQCFGSATHLATSPH